MERYLESKTLLDSYFCQAASTVVGRELWMVKTKQNAPPPSPKRGTYRPMTLKGEKNIINMKEKAEKLG
jgi:hypothetical protein